MTKLRTEDEVKHDAYEILGFNKKEDGVQQGIGQDTTFKMLGFDSDNRPDGWYLPENKQIAIIFEAKSESVKIENKKWKKELLDNVAVVAPHYMHVIGLLYNGLETKVYIDGEQDASFPQELQSKEYYLNYYRESRIDRKYIGELTAKVNNFLFAKIGVNDIYDRMTLTACTIAVTKEGKMPLSKMGFSAFIQQLADALTEILEDKKTFTLPKKFRTMIDDLKQVRQTTPGADDMSEFISLTQKIADNFSSDLWRGEDVMNLFFREFHRYVKKAVKGQVFTPENWASFIYKILDTNYNCFVLDCCVGSGTFLTVSMYNMLESTGGAHSAKAPVIRNSRLYGMEYDSRIFSMCVANMIIHKDGQSNIELMDASTEKAAEWIRTVSEKARRDDCAVRVMMNPPYEDIYSCMKIVRNVLDNVPNGTMCAFILPDKKLEKKSSDTKAILKKHTLRKIVKMPEKTFDAGVTTSIFVFETGRPQEKTDSIFCCYIEDDGFERVKTQGRQDTRGKWQAIEDYWVPIVKNGVCTDDRAKDKIQYWHAEEHLSYQMPEKKFEIFEEDFMKTAMDYLMFEKQINVKEYREQLADTMMYSNEVKNYE